MESSKSQRVARTVLQLAFLIVFAGLIYSNYRLRSETAKWKAVARENLARKTMRAGEPFPTFSARDSGGQRIALAKDLHRDVRLVVVDPGCPSCEGILRRVRQTKPADVIVVSLRPRALSHKIVDLVGNAAPVYFVDRMAPQVLQAHLDVVPRVITVRADGVILQLCHDLDECQAAGKPCSTCTADAGS